jgi:hypothetical protein
LQWVKYNPNTGKYYVCFWDPSGAYDGSHSSGGPTRGTSYQTHAGIFEVDVTKVRGHSQAIGNTYHENFANGLSNGILTKKADVPDTYSGLMSKPIRLAASLWMAHCQDGKQYFSSDLFTWSDDNTSSTYFNSTYAMMNTNSAGVVYRILPNGTAVVYDSTSIVEVYDQAAVAGIIAKGAVTPYEQKAIILSDGDAIYVENEDATNAISITAMGVDV